MTLKWDFFLKKIFDSPFPVFIKTVENNWKQIRFNYPFNLTIQANEAEKYVVLQLKQRQRILDSHSYILHFKGHKCDMVLINDTLIKNPPDTTLKLIDALCDEDKYYIEKDTFSKFCKNIYNTNKNKFHWEIKFSIQKYIPKVITPKPLLDVQQVDAQCIPQLKFKYDRVVIDANETNQIIDLGKMKINRNNTAEEQFQRQLIQTFTEFQCPLILDSAESIQAFYTQIIPALKEHGWLINADNSSFKISDEDYRIPFEVSESQNDWFSFSPNINIGEHVVNYEEIVRMIATNSEYIQTPNGYLKIHADSIKEFQTLNNLNAFDHNQEFNKTEMIGILQSISTDKSPESLQKYNAIIQEYKTKDVVPSSDFKGELRDYQQNCVKWLSLLKEIDASALLADDMGLGKTVQTIAFCTTFKQDHPFLIVGPTNVIFNWESEIRKFYPSASILVYSGSGRSKYRADISEYQFIIVSYGVLKNDIHLFANQMFEVVVLDEAQNIKNPQSQNAIAVNRLQSKFKLAMTGTPIENNLIDLWSIFQFILPNYLGKLNSKKDLLDSQQVIKEKIKPFILRRLKEDVLDALPEKTEQVVRVKLAENQELLYAQLIKSVKVGLKDYSGKNIKLNILAALTKLRQICICPSLISDVGNTESLSPKIEFLINKTTQLVELGHKITIFTQFTKALDILENIYNRNQIYVERIDGGVSSKQRLERVNRFQESQKPGVFIISLKAGGVGLNITAADYVFHLDPWWNPAAEAQATDRVHRFGQKNKVNVYKLVAHETIEEKIVDLQNEKSKLMEDVVSGTGQSFDFEVIKSIISV